MQFKNYLLILVISLTLVLLTSCNFVKQGIEANLLNNIVPSSNDSGTKLFKSITDSNGNFEGLIEAIDEGANINTVPISGSSRLSMREKNPVALAVSMVGHMDLAKYLISKGSNPNYMGDLGKSLLMDSAACLDNDFCEFLIKHGAKIELEGKNEFAGYTALEFVFLSDYYAYPEAACYNTYNFLIKNGARVSPKTLDVAMKGALKGNCSFSLVKKVFEDLLNSGQQSGFNSILESAILGDSIKVQELVITTNISEDDKKNTMLYLAAFGNIEAINLLINKGYDLKSEGGRGMNLLAIACKYNNGEMVKFLYEKGLNPRELNYKGYDALTLAISNDKLYNAKFLISKGFKLQMRKPRDENVDADVLRIAIVNGNLNTVKFVIENGYILNKTRSYIAMNEAVKYGHIYLLKYLLGIGLNSNDEYETSTVLSDAMYFGNLDIVKLLVESGAKVNGGSIKGSPLRAASQYRKVDIAKFLIEKGADVNAKGLYKDGSIADTILNMAIYSGSLEIVKLLVDNGADLNYKHPSRKKDAIQIAEEYTSKCIAEFLKQKQLDSKKS